MVKYQNANNYSKTLKKIDSKISNNILFKTNNINYYSYNLLINKKDLSFAQKIFLRILVVFCYYTFISKDDDINKQFRNKKFNGSISSVFVNSYYIESGNQTNNNFTKELKNFTFGSCFGGFLSLKEEDIFESIIKYKPEFFIWTGDVTYIDNAYTSTLNDWYSTDHFNMDYAISSYNHTYNNEFYKTFREGTPIIGVYDDHDYGINNSHKNFKHKEITKSLFLDFLEEPLSSMRREKGRGIYTSYNFYENSNKLKNKSFKNVKIILLDIRFDKTQYFDNDQDMLGKEQWEWLEEELRESVRMNFTFTFIVSGTEILPISRLITDVWYLDARKRLFNLIGELKVSGVLFISGDVHVGEVSRTFCIHPKIGYHLYELTSSGLTHYTPFAQPVLDYIYPRDYSYIKVVNDYNFGIISFNWEDSQNQSSFTYKIMDKKNYTRTSITIKYEDLTFNEHYKNNEECEIKLNRMFKSMIEYYEIYSNNPIFIFNILVGLCIWITFGYFCFYTIYYAISLLILIFSFFKSKILAKN